MNLLIFRVNQLGDNVVFLPVVQTLRRLCPSWQLSLLTSPLAAALYDADIPPGQRIIVSTADFLRLWKHPVKLGKLWWHVRRSAPSACLVAEDQGNVAHLLARLSGARVRVGAKSDFLKIPSGLTSEVELPEHPSAAGVAWEVARRLVNELGVSEWPEKAPRPNLDHLVGSQRIIPGRIVIHPGASLGYQRWPVDRYVRLAAQLAGEFEIVWIESPEVATPALPKGLRILRPQSLGELVRIIASASLFVGNNSGPMNLAVALGRPSVIINGPSSLAWDPYWHPERVRMLRDPSLSCQPCDRYSRAARVCGNVAEPLACLNRWSADTVAEICTGWSRQWEGNC